MELFWRTPWPGIIVWSALYCSDWLLTLVGARMSRGDISKTLVIEGSYELTPLFQPDVDALRTLSPRFLAMLAGTTALMWVLWQVDVLGAYGVVLGAYVCVELAIHVRHLRNLFLFRAIARQHGVHGRMECSRELLLVMSSHEILSFSALFFVVFVFTGSRFVFGGAVGCALLGSQHWKLPRTPDGAPQPEAPGQSA